MLRGFSKIYFFLVFFGFLFSGITLADSMPTKGFLMVSSPYCLIPLQPHQKCPTASLFPYPIYLYKNGAQVGYVATPSAQVFLGKYAPGKASESDGTYTLYYKGTDNWHSCTLVLNQGSVVNGPGKTTCPGAVTNPPKNYADSSGVFYSNVWTAGFGSILWPAGPAPANPAVPKYESRKITFENKTDYAVIEISGSYCTSFAAKCPKTAFKQQILQGKHYDFPIPLSGINSAAFYVTKYCTAMMQGSCSTWVSTGGYGAGETPYATKIEFTFLAVNNGVPTGASNADISAVDGFNTAAQLAPVSHTYCTYTVPPEDSQLLGAGSYGPNKPLAKLVSSGAGSLQSLCAGSSQLYANYQGSMQPWLLSVQSGSQYTGCRSPCSYATITFGSGTPLMNKFCCAGPDATSKSCIVPTDTVGANTSTYVTNILHSPKQFQNVYPFGYGDAGSDYACPPETSFVVTFT